MLAFRFPQATICAAVGLSVLAIVAHGPASSAAELRTRGDFSSIAEAEARSLAVFDEIGRVLQHPRCVNCHPAGDRPLQNDDMRPHQPPVVRGEGNIGAVGMRCSTCHQSKNIDHAGLPGHPEWHLAPIEMAWEGKSLGDICRQIKDPARNGGKSMQELHQHMAEDSLVGWGWKPDAARAPVPGTQKAFGDLFAYWIETGAHCPR